MQNTQLRGIYYAEAIRSMLSDSHLSLKEVSKSTNIAYLHLIEIRQGSTPKLVEDYLSLIDYAEKYFEGGRKYTPPYDINGKAIERSLYCFARSKELRYAASKTSLSPCFPSR